MKKEYIYCSISVLCWGSLATISKLLVGQLDAMYTLAFGFLFATIGLFFYVLKTGKLKKIKELSLKNIIKMILIGSLGVFFYNFLFLMGTSRLPAQKAFVINDLWPALIIVFSIVLLKERANIGKLIAIICSFAGVIVVATNGDFATFTSSTDYIGVLFCVADAISYALYSVLSKKESYDSDLFVLVAYASGTVISFLCLLLTGPIAMPTVKLTFGLIAYGIICNAVPYVAWSKALEGNTAIIANLAYLTPVVSLFVTHFVLGEAITFFSVFGLVLIIGGIIIQFFVEQKMESRQTL